ncbi:phage head-tail connector protein [Niallia circulans]|uniref:phage head-tail connector protein n=1 Tax=Niallia circulans TaxID=1397 RepID=UPI0035236AF7
MRDKVLKIIKRRLKLDDESLDDLIMDYIEQAEWKIRNYCNLKVVPEGLLFTWASIAIDLFKINHPNEEVVQSLTDDSFNSFTVGKFSATKNSSQNQGVTNSADNLLTSYTSELNAFRRLKTI